MARRWRRARRAFVLTRERVVDLTTCPLPQVVSLVATSLPASKLETAAGKVASRSTLVVVPPALVEQWEFEIEKALGGSGALSACTVSAVVNYMLTHDSGASEAKLAGAIAKYDMVLTTYDQLVKRGTLLARVAWARVVLDEMQARSCWCRHRR